MVFSQLRQLLHTLLPPVLQDLLQILSRNRSQLSSFLVSSLRLPLNDLLHLRNAGCDHGLGTLLPHLPAQQLPANCTRCHRETQVSGVVHQLQDSVGCIISWTIAELVYPRVPTRPLGIPLREVGKYFGNE